MKVKFNGSLGLIVVPAEFKGPSGEGILRLALDTGATTTMINAAPLVAAGYDLALAPERVQITTGSGVEFVPRVMLTRLTALGQEELRFPVLCHTLPPSAGVDGVLGLDFMRKRVLFKRGTIELKA